MYSMKSWTTIEGSPIPQGVAWVEEEQAYNFAIYSKHAESVTLLAYKEDDVLNPVFSHSLDYL
jgi:isoamylase